MAMTALLTQPFPAILGNDTAFLIAIANSGASTVNVNSIQVTVQNPNGQTTSAPPCYVGQPVAPVGMGLAQVSGSQFNVQVPASSTVYFPFSVQFFGHTVIGGPATAVPAFQVSANCFTSDNAVFSPPALNVLLNSPTLGQPGSPPNPVPAVGQLVYTAPSSSSLSP